MGEITGGKSTSEVRSSGAKSEIGKSTEASSFQETGNLFESKNFESNESIGYFDEPNRSQEFSPEVAVSEINSCTEETERFADNFEGASGINQILETPFSIEHVELYVNELHSQSISQILEMNGKYIAPMDKQRLEQGVDNLHVIEYDPNSGHLGFYRTLNGESNITVEAINKEQLERTIVHETNHFASKNREIIVPAPEKGGYMVYQTVGMRHTSWFHNNMTGKNEGFKTEGRGLNEGMTTLYTNEQLYNLSPEKGKAAEREGVYFQATEICKELNKIMGPDCLGEAYYGGETMKLQEQIDLCCGDGTFKRLQGCLDKTISKIPAERNQAMKEGHEILSEIHKKLKHS